MNRRSFIKNSLLLCGYSYLAYRGKIFYDHKCKDMDFDLIKLEKNYLTEEYKNKSELPKKIRIEACSLCQLNCVCCPMRLHPDKFKNNGGFGYLKFANYKKLIDDNSFEQVELSNNGEIFLNPELLDIIKYSYKKNINLTAFNGVNLNYLTDEMAEALVKYQFKEMIVSIDGASPKTYAIYRRGGDFNTVINHIKKINYFKKKYNSKYPILTYKFILFGHNEHEIDKAKCLAKKLDMKMLFYTNFDPKYSPVKNIELVRKKTGIDTTIPYFMEAAKEYQQNHRKNLSCKNLWEEPQINWDGKISGCCSNPFITFGGNAFKDGLLKALNNPKIIYAKKMLTNNAKPISGIPCCTCDYFRNLKKIGSSIET